MLVRRLLEVSLRRVVTTLAMASLMVNHIDGVGGGLNIGYDRVDRVVM